MSMYRVKIFVLIILTSTCVNLFSQTLSEFESNGDDFFQKEDYKKALLNYTIVKAGYEKENKNSRIEYGELLLKIAKTNAMLNDFSIIDSLFNTADKVFLFDSINTYSQRYECLKMRIGYYIQNQDYENTDKFYYLFQHLVDKNKIRDSLDYYQTLEVFGLSKFKLQKFDEGEIIYNQIIQFYKKDKSIKSQKELCEILSVLAGLYQNCGRLRLAEEYYIKNYEVASKIYDRKGDDFLNSLQQLAGFYANQGYYSKALLLYVYGNKIIKTAFGENSIEYANAIQMTGSVYIMTGELDSAKIFIERAMALKSKLIGENNKAFSTVLIPYGECLMRIGQMSEAEKIFKKALSNYQLPLSNSEISTVRLILDRLGQIYQNVGDFDKAEASYVNSLEMVRKVYEIDNPEVLFSIESLAGFYKNIQNFQKADSLFIIALMIRRSSIIPDSLSLSYTLNTYAMMLSSIGQYSKAEDCLIEARNIVAAKGVNSNEYLWHSLSLANLYNHYKTQESKNILLQLKNQYNAGAFSNVDNISFLQLLFVQLGQFSLDQNDFISAEIYYKNCVQITKDKFGIYNSYYADALTSLGDFYYEIGSLEKAENKYQEAYEIQKKANSSYFSAAEMLGLLYIHQHKYKLARSIYHDCYKYYINKKIVNIDFFSTLINIAELESLTGNIDLARKKYLDAIALMQKSGYDKNIIYLNSIVQYAEFCNRYKKYNEADSMYNLALAQYKILKNHGKYAYILFRIADNKSDAGQLSQADSLYQISISLLESSFDKSSFDLQSYYGSLAWFYMSYNPKMGLHYFDKMFINSQKNIANQFAYLSENEKLSYVNKVNQSFFADLSNIYRDAYLQNSLSSYSYNNTLLTKGIVLKSVQGINNIIHNTDDKKIIVDWSKYDSLKKEVAKFYALPSLNRPSDLKSKEEQVEVIEKELLKKSKTFSNFQTTLYVDWEKVQSALDKTSAAIEFISFPYYKNGWTDSVLYIALVLRPDFKEPRLVYLFEEKQLSLTLKKGEGILDQSYINGLYHQKEGGNSLYQLIWKPIDSLLQGVKNVYISPSGLLHKISLGAIPLTDSTTIGEQYNLQILGTTADVINKEETFINKASINNALLFGGINYDVASSKTTGFVDNAYAKDYVYVPVDSTRGATGKWNYLNGSLKEAEGISRQFMEQKITTHFYSDSTATETLFKNIPLKKSSVIHIATHGYFFPDISRKKEYRMPFTGEEKQSTFQVSENPLLRSGLIFAGANPVWTNPNYVSTMTDDGILTAYEISNIDLSNVKLVVLSACETGLGDIKGSEGVFGLQRSFKLAGVKNIIMSLWKVPDDKTRELMQLFYQNCFTGNSISVAFKLAQQEMRSKYPNSPYYWAGFTLLQ